MKASPFLTAFIVSSKGKSKGKIRVKRKSRTLEALQIKGPAMRSGWDSNPRDVAVKLISSQPRYDRFDTAP